MRKTEIAKYIDQIGSVTVVDLSDRFHVSVETIRRDLKSLETLGKVIRVHGGAVSINERDIGESFADRSKSKVNEKRLLVEQALKYISEDQFIGLDASSSSWELAKIIPNINCTIVTNSLDIISVLKSKFNINVISTGGRFSEKYGAFSGKIAMSTLENMSLDLSFISCVGFDYNGSVWDSNEFNCQIKQSFIGISEKVILIADKTKLGKRSLLKICDSSEVDSIISDTDNIEAENN
ncbi:DeoR/GlpR family DNA-binding transcription regulator [Vibrio scophthalmi]|uniref:Putative HTH-type transcriptional regulator YgbI n=1 Tax=Vibrio scophthalmi TaxID=45658 RepID=A0A1C7FDU7_9VIBR|nr:DeoR/GlpR family DNA-binding transcription regulator [Vibrio scophthalmi]ANU38150.1 putative HTH-type transcriptional regulator YgbI [Vibrio scophthalmi]